MRRLWMWFILLTLLFLCCCKPSHHVNVSSTTNTTNTTNSTSLPLNVTNTTVLLSSTINQSKSLSFREKLEMDVLSAPYNTSDYKPNSFDCSQMAALLYDWLKLKGYDVKFVIAMGDNWIGHTWLLVGNLTLPHFSSSDFSVVERRTADGVGKVLIVTFSNYNSSYFRLSKNSYWIEPTLKLVYKNLTDVWSIDQILTWHKIYIYDDYRHSTELSQFLLLSFDKEFNYTPYLLKHYGVSSLEELLKR